MIRRIAESKMPVNRETFLKISVRVQGSRVQCFIDNNKLFEFVDKKDITGRVGIYSNSLCDFKGFKVYMGKEDDTGSNRRFDTGKHLNEISEYTLSEKSSVQPFVIGNFRIEIKGGNIVKTESYTGKVVKQDALPASGPFVGQRGAELLPGGLYHYTSYCCDTDGLIILRDGTAAGGYSFWVYNTEPNLLWYAHTQMPGIGRNITFLDINGDGKPEIIAGYECFSLDGTRLWQMEEGLYLSEPSCCSVMGLDKQGEACILMGAGHNGIYIVNRWDGKVMGNIPVGQCDDIISFKSKDHGLGYYAVKHERVCGERSVGTLTLIDRYLEIKHVIEPNFPYRSVKIMETDNDILFLFIAYNEESGGLYDVNGIKFT